MNIIIEIYIVVCILLLLFDIGFLIIKNRKTSAFYPKNTDFEKEIREEFSQHPDGTYSRGFLNDLDSKLSKTKNLITLVSVLEEKPEARIFFAPYVFRLLEKYKKKSDSEQAYYTYVISLFDYDEKAIPPEFMGGFMEFLDAESLYIFSNTMEALYHLGRPNLLIQALGKVDERGEFYHKKLLVDGLLSSNVDFDEFNPMVIEKFDRYKPYLQDCLLDFFRMNGYDIHALCMKLIANAETDEQVRYSAMRYLGKFPTAESKKYFMDVLDRAEDENWVPSMLAIQALGRDEDPKVRSAVKSKITSRHWYIRLHASEYLFRHQLSKSEIYDILEKRDKYSDEILRYQYRDDKAMSAYILETIKMFEEQDKAEQAGRKSATAITNTVSV